MPDSHRVARRAVVASLGAGMLWMASVSPSPAQALGDGLTYTALTPCRIVDTRNSTAGPIKAGGTRIFQGAGPASFVDQGGGHGDCGVAGLAPAALAITITVVSPDAAGFTTVLPDDRPRPLSASLTYRRGDIVTTTVFTPAMADGVDPAARFAVYSHALADYVIDLVGYFAAGRRLVSCQESGYNIAWITPGQVGTVTAGSCLDGFTATGTNCDINGVGRLLQAHHGTCGFINDSPYSTPIAASRSCCRVDGR